MKKVLYSLMMVAAVLTGCTTWDDPVTENYGEGPSVSIDVTTTTDSTFTFTITPGAGAQYYSYVVDASDEAEALDAATLLKGGYSSVAQAVLNVDKNADFTSDMRDAKSAPLCLPNTTYQIYAVAATDKGIVGDVVVASVKTTDTGAPAYQSFSGDPAAKAATVTFNQTVTRGDGKVTGTYYKEFDWDNPVAIDSIAVAISGSKVTFTTPTVPANADVIISWEEGAFVDAVNNKCAAFTSKYNEATDKFQGVTYKVKSAEWAVADSCFTAPKAGSTFPKWNEFEGTITFEDKVYVIEKNIKAGDFSVTYTGESRTVTYKLPVENIDFGLAEDLSTQKITFTLPQATAAGDKVTVSIKEGILYDVYGNKNTAYASEKVYWTAFAMKKSDFIGDFTYTWVNYNTGAEASGEITIKEDPDEENGIIMDGLWGFKDLYGSYDLDECKIYLYNQPVGVISGYYATIENAETYDPISFTVNADGTIVCDYIFGMFGYSDADYENYVGAFRYAKSCVLTKKTSTAQSPAKAMGTDTVWSLSASKTHSAKKLYRK